MERLLAQVRVGAEVLRGGHEVTIPPEDLVVGDVLVLNAGDIVPADGRVLTSRQLLVDESGLTGESFPVEKKPGAPGGRVTSGGTARGGGWPAVIDNEGLVHAPPCTVAVVKRCRRAAQLETSTWDG